MQYVVGRVSQTHTMDAIVIVDGKTMIWLVEGGINTPTTKISCYLSTQNSGTPYVLGDINND